MSTDPAKEVPVEEANARHLAANLLLVLQGKTDVAVTEEQATVLLKAALAIHTTRIDYKTPAENAAASRVMLDPGELG